MSIKITEEQILNIIGGQAGAEEIMTEVVADRLDDDGYLVYIPPEHSLIEVDSDTVDELAEQGALEQLRHTFADLRKKIYDALNEVFEEMKDHDSDTEIKLNKFYSIEITEEDIDTIMFAILDGVDDE